MEDILLMRKSRSAVYPITVGTNAVQIVPHNPKRISLELFTTAVGSCFIGQNSSVSTTTGWEITSTQQPYRRNLLYDGYLACLELWAISAGAGRQIWVIDTTLEG